MCSKSRPGQSIIIDNDDDSMTSGDESDNASITDSDPSGSEVGGLGKLDAFSYEPFD